MFLENEELPVKKYSKEEMKEKFLDTIRGYIRYWSSDKYVGNKTIEERLEGLAFSILVIIDGESAGHPPYYLIPAQTLLEDDPGSHFPYVNKHDAYVIEKYNIAQGTMFHNMLHKRK